MWPFQVEPETAASDFSSNGTKCATRAQNCRPRLLPSKAPTFPRTSTTITERTTTTARVIGPPAAPTQLDGAVPRGCTRAARASAVGGQRHAAPTAGARRAVALGAPAVPAGSGTRSSLVSHQLERRIGGGPGGSVRRVRPSVEPGVAGARRSTGGAAAGRAAGERRRRAACFFVSVRYWSSSGTAGSAAGGTNAAAGGAWWHGELPACRSERAAAIGSAHGPQPSSVQQAGRQGPLIVSLI